MLAHEICKRKPARDTGPLWECLRHRRNAAGHGGRFNFLNGEPTRPAVWGSLEIVRGLQGMPLFHTPSSAGLLRFGDPLYLLRDIEQA